MNNDKPRGVNCNCYHQTDEVAATTMDECQEVDEKKPLLIDKESINIGSSSPQNTSATKLYVLYFILTIFMCGMEMTTMSANQYLYQRLEENSVNNSGKSTPMTQKTENQTTCLSNSSANENDFQKEASDWFLYLGLTETGLTLLVVVFLGVYSDFVGRKPLMLVSLIAYALKSGMICTVIYFKLDISYFYISQVLGGLGGAHYTFSVGFLSSVADTTKYNKDRSFGIALMDLFMGIGVSASQIATGYLIQLLGYLYPVLICAIFCVVSAIIVVTCVTETNKNTESKSISFTSAFNNFTGFYRSSSYTKGNPVWKFILCLFGLFLGLFPMGASQTIQTLFLLRSPFCFLSEDIGWFLCACYFIKLVVGILSIKLLHLCLSDQGIAFLGCLSATAFFVILGFSSETFWLYIAAGASLLSIVQYPMFRAMASKMVDRRTQGALFANILVWQVICTLCSVSAFNNLYALTQDFMVGLTFLVMAGISLISALTVIPLMISGVTKDLDCSKDVTITE